MLLFNSSFNISLNYIRWLRAIFYAGKSFCRSSCYNYYSRSFIIKSKKDPAPKMRVRPCCKAPNRWTNIEQVISELAANIKEGEHNPRASHANAFFKAQLFSRQPIVITLPLRVDFESIGKLLFLRAFFTDWSPMFFGYRGAKNRIIDKAGKLLLISRRFSF